MTPMRFPESNRTLTKPEDMTDEDCAPMEAWTDRVVCVSCWKMTWGERVKAMFFGRVWCYVHSGHTQPPISLTVAKTVFRVEPVTEG